jgi:DNA invertase Pin-like site-specific DNA recombinase
VSTAKQADEGQSIDVQARTIAGYAMMIGLEIDKNFIEGGVSGSVPLVHRPQGKSLLATLQAGDVVITAKLDRMFRSALDALAVLADLKERGISLHMVDLDGDVTTNGISKLVFTILSAVAEAERDRIRERISTVKADQKARGCFLGGLPRTATARWKTKRGKTSWYRSRSSRKSSCGFGRHEPRESRCVRSAARWDWDCLWTQLHAFAGMRDPVEPAWVVTTRPVPVPQDSTGPGTVAAIGRHQMVELAEADLPRGIVAAYASAGRVLEPARTKGTSCTPERGPVWSGGVLRIRMPGVKQQ